jgi:hypothetical protein
MTDQRHAAAIAEADALTKTDGVKVSGGKKYLMVKDRVNVMRRHYALELGIETELLQSDDPKLIRVAARITDTSGRVIGSGHAEELRGSTNVNSTSALENAETSAVGRALASIGLHGGEYASLNEIEMARSHETQLKQPPEPEPVPLKTVSKTDDPPFDDSDTRKVVDWAPWCAQSYGDISELTTEASLRGWMNSNQPTLAKLEAAEPAMYEELGKHWDNLVRKHRKE